MLPESNDPEEQEIEVKFGDCSPARVIFPASFKQQMIDGATHAIASPGNPGSLEFRVEHPTNKLDHNCGWDAQDVGFIQILISPNPKPPKP